MWPRDKRWFGSLGIYYPGPGFHWKEHNGIARCVVNEGQQTFGTEEDALKWISDQKTQTWVWRNDGLLIGWSKKLPRKQLNVDVWQVLIDGRKPTRFAGAQDDKIVVDRPSSDEGAVSAEMPENTPH